MNISDLSKKFKKELKDYYSLPEVQSLLYLVFQNLLSLSKTDIHLNHGKKIPDEIIERFDEIIFELRRKKPVQYILGRTEFFECKFNLNNHTLIPRPETEELVKWIIDETKNCKQNILDIGTGSGCIAVSLAKNITEARIFASDNSEEALKIARQNALLNKTVINFMYFDILHRESFSLEESDKMDIIVSNPPYVTEAEKVLLGDNILKYEPHEALFVPDNKPLLYYSAILEFAREKMRDCGEIFFEINEKFGEQMIRLLEKYDYNRIILQKDINGKDRMIKGTKRAASK